MYSMEINFNKGDADKQFMDQHKSVPHRVV